MISARRYSISLRIAGALSTLVMLASCGIDRVSGPETRSFAKPMSGDASVQGVLGTYDASLGTIPQAQGFVFNTGGGNPPMIVSNGALIADASTTWEAWGRASGADLSQDFVSETVIRVDSSNYIPSSPSSRSWEGYYILVGDNNGQVFHVGLASGGYTLNSLTLVNQPLHPLTLNDGKFHTFRVSVHAGVGSLSMDDSTLVSGIATTPYGPDPNVAFGAANSLSRSLTALKSVCYGSQQTDCITDLALAFVAPVPTFNLNQNAVVTFKVTNTGPRPSTSSTMFVAATPAFRVVSTSGTACTPVGGVLSCALGPVVAGGQQTFSLTVKPILRGTFPVQLTLKGQETDGNKVNNVISRSVIVH